MDIVRLQEYPINIFYYFVELFLLFLKNWIFNKKIDQPKQISSEELAKIIQNTQISTIYRSNNEYNIDLSILNNNKLVKGRYLEVSGIKLKYNKNGKLDIDQIKMINGDIITVNDNRWNLSILHASICLHQYIPSKIHNYVHFHFNDCFVISCYKLLDKKSDLWKLIYPSIRYNIITNNNGLGGIVTDATSSNLIKYIQTFDAISKDDFNKAIYNEVEHFYIKNGKTDTCIEFDFPFKYNGKYMGKLSNDVPIYIYRLSNAYNIYYNYVDDIFKKLSSDEINILYKLMHEILNLMSFNQSKCKIPNIIDFYATHFWLVSFVHTCDHYSSSVLFNKYHIPYYATESFNSGLNPWTNESLIIAENFTTIGMTNCWDFMNTNTICNMEIPNKYIIDRNNLSNKINKIASEIANDLCIENFPIYSSICF
jgi:hypothetical protein